ncbi:hypothetical protein [Geobacter pickeringii]|uniref:SHOCT domain-containing protein n=1 Tax=Geobacter pickeringii TaxID=345632 RepID=A0A0B5B963_9BACT|nr:hypothetical protein [Geobacter pickeringii]AJE03102.1 hypothetical protein GPICK_06720 [Geobacter pickeringii]
METAKRISMDGAAGRLLVMALFVAVGLAGCASLKGGTAETPSVKTIWKVRDQYVQVVPREREGSGTVVVNEHPATVSASEIRGLLASVGLARQGSEAPLFSDTELRILEDAAVKGLNQAGPDEDVTFAVYGYHAALQGFLKETKVTTGRMFYQDGKLNLILGIVQRDVMDTEDRRLNPFVPGSRLKQSDLDGRIKVLNDGAPFTMKRVDWLVFDRYVAPPPVVESLKPATPPAVPAAGPSAPAQEIPKRVERPADKPRNLEERLILLNDLKQKGLITDEEYRSKRLNILDEI